MDWQDSLLFIFFCCFFFLRGICSSKVTVLGYGLLTTDARPLVEALTRQRFSVVVVDESHYLKSRNAARTKILVPLIQSANRAILLTGTPALGRPEEVLYPTIFDCKKSWNHTQCCLPYRLFPPNFFCHIFVFFFLFLFPTSTGRIYICSLKIQYSNIKISFQIIPRCVGLKNVSPMKKKYTCQSFKKVFKTLETWRTFAWDNLKKITRSSGSLETKENEKKYDNWLKISSLYC